MAKAFPNSTFIGYDFHSGSVEQARLHAQQHGVTANTRFEVALASAFPGNDLDLVTFFDCLHDMGDPVGAAQHVRQALKPDGRSEEHKSELQSLMSISFDVFCLKRKQTTHK